MSKKRNQTCDIHFILIGISIPSFLKEEKQRQVALWDKIIFHLIINKILFMRKIEDLKSKK
jgi:hypothetical protein